MSISSLARLVSTATCGWVLLGGFSVATAQTYQIPQPAEVKLADENSVDMVSGIAHFSVSDVAIADLDHSMSSVHNLDAYTNGFYRSVGFDDNFLGGLGFYQQTDNGGAWDYRSSYLAGLRGGEKFFINPDGSLEATDGGTLTGSAGGNLAACGVSGPVSTSATYTRKDGTQMFIDFSMFRSAGGSNHLVRPGGCGVVTKITYPNGLIVRINHKTYIAGSNYSRIQSVTRNDGLQLKYRYAANGELLGVTGVNNAYEACDPLVDSCAFTGVWPQSTYSWSGADSVLTVTDQANRTTRFTMDTSGRVVGVKPPTSTVDKASYKYCSRGTYFSGGVWATDTTGEYCTNVINYYGIIETTTVTDRVVQVVEDGQTWTYRYPTDNYAPYLMRYDVQRPDGMTSVSFMRTLGAGALTGFGSPKFSATFEDSPRNRVLGAGVLGEPYKNYTYDARGNVVSDGIGSAGYDTSCLNMKTCNKPNWVRDHAGNQTDFTYDSTHGGILTETGPAVSGIRPQKRFTYVQRYAWYKNTAGIMTRSTEPIWKVATESFCRTTAASGAGCAVASDQVVTTYDYGPDSGPNNLFLRGVVVTADGQSLRTCYGIDKYGNKISETAPAANLAVCS